MTLQAVLDERERCKGIINRKIDGIIEYRRKKHRKVLIPTFEHLRERLLFLIDNPDYKHHPDYSPRTQKPKEFLDIEE